MSGSLSDDGKVEVGGDSGKSESSLEKSLVDRSDALNIDAKSSNSPSRDEIQREVDKVDKMEEKFMNQPEGIIEKGVFEDGVDVNGSKDENGERGEMKGFWRKPRTEMESVRFSTSKYPNEGPSNGFSSSYMGSWRNRNEADGVDGKEGGKGGAGC
ncbi:uncharacterized protein HKW66_Vig0002870 [Vigna angularis]|nr:uncharacterized protein HKW66_Vig0002870 [Vigna angularis]